MISPISLAAPFVYIFSKSKEVELNVEVYTGACTHYKVSCANGKPTNSVVIREGTGVVAINRTLNTMRFFFRDEPIVFDREFTSFTDDTLNQETFEHDGNEQGVCNYDTKVFELLEGKYLHTERDLYKIADFKRELHTLKVKDDSTELT